MTVTDNTTGPRTTVMPRRPDAQIATIKRLLTERYGLQPRRSRPEELEQRGTSHGVSVQYGCRTVRVRLMEGRRWMGSVDFPIGVLDLRRLHSVCDPWFGTVCA